MRLSKYETAAILANLRTFTYTTKENGEDVTKTVTLWPTEKTALVNRFFLQYEGGLKADDIMDAYKKGDVSAADVAEMIMMMTKSQLVNLWKIWEADYNPLWNVDGSEVKEIKTEFGKVVEREKDSSVTDEQLTDGKNNITHAHTLTDNQTVDGKNNITHAHTLTDNQTVDGKNNVSHGLKLTDEQKTDGKNNVTHGHTLTDNQTVDGKNNTTHGLQTTITEPTDTNTVSAFDSGSNFVNKSQSSATTHSNTESGTTNVALSLGTIQHNEGGTTNTALSIGKVEHAESGTTNTAISLGTIQHTEGGTTNTAISMGTIQHTEGGTTNTATSIGKIKHSSDGKDTDTESGDETTTETYTRTGNIGVTMSTQLLRDGDNFWSQFNFFEKYFVIVAGPITLPIYDDEED